MTAEIHKGSEEVDFQILAVFARPAAPGTSSDAGPSSGPPPAGGGDGQGFQALSLARGEHDRWQAGPCSAGSVQQPGEETVGNRGQWLRTFYSAVMKPPERKEDVEEVEEVQDYLGKSQDKSIPSGFVPRPAS